MCDLTSFGPFRPSRLPGFLYRHFEQGGRIKFNYEDTYLVDEICCLNWPPVRQIGSFDLNLLREHHISNFFATAAYVRSSSKHELVANYSNRKVINSVWMVLPTHDLWCHIPWRSRSILTIFWSKNFRDAHVSNAYIARLLHNDVLWLDISMEHALIMHVFESEDHASQHEFRFILVKPSSFPNVIPEITTGQQVADQI